MRNPRPTRKNKPIGKAKKAPPRDAAGRRKQAAKSPIPRKPSWGRRILFGLLSLFVFMLLAGGASAVLVYNYFSQDLPKVEALKNYRPKTVTFFYADDGRIIGEYSHERRIVVPLAKIPDHVREAFISAEDANFYQHEGLDLVSIARAFIKNLEAGRIVQGGSTINQQVIKTFLLSSERSYSRKIREAILAYRIDNYLTKDESLYLYLNQIYLGHGAYGVESAAELYFNKHVDQLTIAEGAMLAGLVQRPSDYSPFRNFKAARARQEYTINQMAKNGFITQKQAEAALDQKLQFYDRPNVNLTMTPYFTEHVRRMMEEQFTAERLYNDGFRVYTTVNVDMQAAARRAVHRGLKEFALRRKYRGPIKKLDRERAEKFIREQVKALEEDPLAAGREVEALVTKVEPKANRVHVQIGEHKGVIEKSGLKWILGRGKRLSQMVVAGDVVLVEVVKKDKDSGQFVYKLLQKPRVQSALMCLQNKDGAVKAMIGGRDFSESQYNRAIQAQRQPGSSFKAVVYTTAMENGFTPGSILIDSPIVYDDFAHGRRWKPTNFDRKFYGPTTLYNGLTSSRNVMAVKLIAKLGPEKVIDMARKMGIQSPLAKNLSLALGSSGVSLVEMVTAFSTFPNLGERVEPLYVTLVEDRYGRVVKAYQPQRVRVVPPETACILQYMLRGVVDHGTGVRVKKLGRPVGGKTGTTNDLADAWFVGFTPEYTAGAWVGRDEMKRMGYGESGGRAAAPIFLYFLQDVYEGKPQTEFEIPEGVTIVDNGNVGICYKEGTVGKGYSEVAPEASGDFLKSEIDEKSL